MSIKFTRIIISNGNLRYITNMNSLMLMYTALCYNPKGARELYKTKQYYHLGIL